MKRDVASWRVFESYVREVGLIDRLMKIARSHHVKLQDTYLDAKGPSVVAARLEIWWTLMNDGKSIAEIARMYDRDHSSISYAMRNIMAKAEVALNSENIHTAAQYVVTLRKTRKAS